MRTRWEHIVQVSEVHHGGSHVPRRARPPWTFFNDVITACGWSTKVAELERYLLGGRIKGPPGAIALILGRQRGRSRGFIGAEREKYPQKFAHCVRQTPVCRLQKDFRQGHAAALCGHYHGPHPQVAHRAAVCTRPARPRMPTSTTTMLSDKRRPAAAQK